MQKHHSQSSPGWTSLPVLPQRPNQEKPSPAGTRFSATSARSYVQFLSRALERGFTPQSPRQRQKRELVSRQFESGWGRSTVLVGVKGEASFLALRTRDEVC